MSNALAHRGPDDSGFYSQERISLGHRRLAIIDLSKDGHQPMTSYDGRLTIIHNGEIYNYKALRHDLQRVAIGTTESAYPFRTQTDTEVIIASYLRWGKECLAYLNGMYAFAIWDDRDKELFIARDRLGIKPLYYWSDGATFVFSSELRTLLKSGIVPRKINLKSLADYVTYQTVHAPFTIIENVKMLLPGHYMVIKEGKEYKQVKYWSVSDVVTKSKDDSYEMAKRKVKQLLFSAVERRLISDVSLGAFLSGGIDSGTIVAIMSKVMGAKVKTFSITFNEKEYNESEYSNTVAKLYGTEHHEIKLTLGDFLTKLPEAMHAMDHPSGDGINTYVVSDATRKQGVTVALSGLGSDELFAGYPLFKRLYRLEKYNWMKSLTGLPLQVNNLFNRSVASQKLLELQKLPGWGIANTYPLARQLLLTQESGSILLNTEGLNRIPELNSSHGLLSGISTAELTNYLTDILLRDTDQMSMAHALEVRVPFLDYHLVEYVIGLSDRVKYPHTPKKLLTDAVEGLLPESIINRKKMGFTLPWSQWMNNELKPFCDENINRLTQTSYFKNSALLLLWDRFQRNDSLIPWYKIWHLAVLGNWININSIND